MAQQLIQVSKIENGQHINETTVLEISDELKKAIAEAQEFWNKQDQLAAGCQHNGDVEYYPDFTHPECSKHCWVCKSCNTIIQIG